MIWTLLPGAVFLADGCLKKKAEEELKENEQIPVCKGHIVLRKCHNRAVAGGGGQHEEGGNSHLLFAVRTVGASRSAGGQT